MWNSAYNIQRVKADFLKKTIINQTKVFEEAFKVCGATVKHVTINFQKSSVPNAEQNLFVSQSIALCQDLESLTLEGYMQDATV